jgi:hypothetical protein
MNIETTITIGNIITSTSVIISIIALYSLWRKERKLKIKVKADLIRQAAAKTLKSIERWKEISLSLFYKCDFDFVETSEMIPGKDFIELDELKKARDFLWKRLKSIVAENKDLILKEDLKNTYLDLFAYIPDIKQLFESTIQNLLKAEVEMINDFIVDKTQKEILNINNHIEYQYDSSILGNQLRYARNDSLTKYNEEIDSETKSIKNILIEFIKEKDMKLTRYNKGS